MTAIKASVSSNYQRFVATSVSNYPHLNLPDSLTLRDSMKHYKAPLSLAL